MSKELLSRFRISEAYGEIPQGTAVAATFATVAELGLKAAYEGYFSKEWVNKAYEDAAKVEQQALDISNEVVADIRELARTMEATHTTSDFPVALANLRARAIREQYAGSDSNWRTFASVTTAPDFKPIRSIRFQEAPELLRRPEGTSVQYLTLTESEDGYRVANYERGIKYTWEMYVNDEVGRFAAALNSFGRGARRTEVMVVFESIRDGLPRTVLSSGPGVPTIERLTEMEDLLTMRTYVDSDGNAVEYGYMLTDVIHGTRERQYINTVLNQENRASSPDVPNPMRGAFEPHLERLWSRVMGRDIVGYDRSVNWLEVAFLQGFEGGPKTYVKMPTSRDFPDEGSFEDHTLHIKMGHTLGAKVIVPEAAIRVEGAV